MRKLRAGLGSLALAAGLATTYALSAPAAPPAETSAQRAVVDELPNPAEEKRRALREVAIQDVLAGDAKVRQRGASEVVKVADDQYVELRLLFLVNEGPGATGLSPQSKAMVEAIAENTGRDVPIWEHKVYRERAPLVPGDGPINTIRKWARQFYEEPSAAR